MDKKNLHSYWITQLMLSSLQTSACDLYYTFHPMMSYQLIKQQYTKHVDQSHPFSVFMEGSVKKTEWESCTRPCHLYPPFHFLLFLSYIYGICSLCNNSKLSWARITTLIPNMRRSTDWSNCDTEVFVSSTNTNFLPSFLPDSDYTILFYGRSIKVKWTILLNCQ